VFEVINLPTFSDDRGSLTVVEKVLPFEVKRLFYISDAIGKRGGHRHKKTIQAMVILGGSAEIYMNNGKEEETILLDSQEKCLIIKPEDWHTMDNVSKGAVILVLASEEFDPEDYIMEPY
jgi:dTDP-4-dehydrorhamnose 3,5-epimerase-like enzyme